MLAHRITLWKAITPAIIKLPAEREQGQPQSLSRQQELCWKIIEHGWVYIGDKVSKSAQRPCETKTCHFHISKMVIGREISGKALAMLMDLESKHWTMLSFMTWGYSHTLFHLGMKRISSDAGNARKFKRAKNKQREAPKLLPPQITWGTLSPCPELHTMFWFLQNSTWWNAPQFSTYSLGILQTQLWYTSKFSARNTISFSGLKMNTFHFFGKCLYWFRKQHSVVTHARLLLMNPQGLQEHKWGMKLWKCWRTSPQPFGFQTAPFISQNKWGSWEIIFAKEATQHEHMNSSTWKIQRLPKWSPKFYVKLKKEFRNL